MYILSLIINLIIVSILLLDPHYKPVGYFMLFAYSLSLLGFVYKITKTKSIGYLAMAGFACFIPIGVIGMIGMAKLMEDQKKKEFISEMDND
ncbi:hypothetical protein [Vibrio fluminensis]|uniref:hypothetical protein n=1 Tax=Vibrio fluminensis TaxID=2783614 RepID=UPI00188742B6|nr:hypothetical protein [Vibrio fluminensis]